MKLRNKKTGEITSNYDLVAIQGIDMDKGIDYICLQTEDGKKYVYYSLADFNAEWEDFKESKEGAIEEIIRKLEADFEMYPSEWNNLEEAKKVVEKLKAWKRLKDKGFRFTGFSGGRTIIEFTFDKSNEPGSAYKDLDLLFGGKE